MPTAKRGGNACLPLPSLHHCSHDRRERGGRGLPSGGRGSASPGYGIFTARVAKRAKVMFSQVCVTRSVQLQGGGGGVCPPTKADPLPAKGDPPPAKADPPPAGNTVNGRAVRILLECILVVYIYHLGQRLFLLLKKGKGFRGIYKVDE